jgi:hypothetical protein
MSTVIDDFMDQDVKVKVNIRKPKTEGNFNLRFVIPKRMGQSEEHNHDIEDVVAPLNYN